MTVDSNKILSHMILDRSYNNTQNVIIHCDEENYDNVKKIVDEYLEKYDNIIDINIRKCEFKNSLRSISVKTAQMPWIYWLEECNYCRNRHKCEYMAATCEFREKLREMEKTTKGVYGTLKFKCDYFVIDNTVYRKNVMAQKASLHD